MVLHIDEAENGFYTTTSNDGIHNSYDWSINNIARLWTIQDAKDGDVLHSPSHHLIWIYKDNKHYYACVNMNYVSENISTDGLISIPNDACPATKDEQTILFAKMKENGYEWDDDKKKLKKIEQKPTWSEEDEDMLYKATAVINRLCAARREYVWSVNTLDKLFYWLKSLKDRVQLQPKQEWSENDVFIEKAVEWLSNNLQTIVDVDCQSKHHVESIPVLGSITQTEFLNKFRKEIKYLLD